MNKRALFLVLLLFSLPAHCGIWEFLMGTPKEEDSSVEGKRELTAEESVMCENAARIYFNMGDKERFRSLTISGSLMKHLAPRINGGRKSLRTVLAQMEEGKAPKQEEFLDVSFVDRQRSQSISTPVSPLMLANNDRKNLSELMHDIVTESLEEAFKEKEDRIHKQELTLESQRIRVKIAVISAITTIATSALATTVAILVNRSE